LEVNVEADRTCGFERDPQLHGSLAALELADDAPVDADYIRDVLLGEVQLAAAVAYRGSELGGCHHSIHVIDR